MSHDDHLKQQLDRSINTMTSQVEQQLLSRVSIAKSQAKHSNRKLGYALAPVAVVLTIWFSAMTNTGLSQEEQLFYDDLEYLISEDELGFLEDMDISDWILDAEISSET